MSREPPTSTDHSIDEAASRLGAGRLLLFVLLSFLGNLAGSTLRYPEIGSALLFPPYAVLTAVLLVSPLRTWLGYVALAALIHDATHWPHWSLSWVLLADLANTARALVAAGLLRLVFNRELHLDSIGRLLYFVLSAVLVAPAVGATLGAANVVLHGASDSYWRTWGAWFLSNALTGLTMLPGVFALFTSSVRWRSGLPSRSRAFEAALLAIALVFVCAAAFALPGPRDWSPELRFYAPLPVLLWAALRFGAGGASFGLTVVAFAAVWAADRGVGPFRASAPDESVLTLQLFLLLTALPVLCLAALDSARLRVVRLYHALLASTRDEVAILDARGVVLEVNESWRRQTPAQALPPLDSTGPGEDYVAACRRAAEAGDDDAARAREGLARVLRREARLFEMECERTEHGRFYTLTVEALERPDGGAVVTRADVTARREAQRLIDEQRSELSHLSRVVTVGQLSGALAHELNQPLAAILGNAAAGRHLLEHELPDRGQLRDIFLDIERDDRRAAEVIKSLRALLKRGDPRPQPVDLAKLVGEVMELAGSELVARRVRATTSVAPGLRPVLADRVQLQQVLLNLVLNACEAMDGVAPADRALSVSACADNGRAHLAVRDRGAGIAQSVIGRMFEPFVTTKPGGLGLGLSISGQIVVSHGGRIWAENNEDGGATLHCTLTFAGAKEKGLR